jgi:hypothetical protein
MLSCRLPWHENTLFPCTSFSHLQVLQESTPFFFLILHHTTSVMKLRRFAAAILAACTAYAFPSTSIDSTEIAYRADSSLVGYLGVFFLGDAPNIYFYLSNGNNPISLKALNKGNPILTPTLGTKGVRDPSIVNGNGTEEGKKWYIIGTDLDIAKVRFSALLDFPFLTSDQTTWDASQRKGSQSIHIWESTDLINWGTERLVKVEDDAGMVWAPDAIWDPSKGLTSAPFSISQT